MKICCFIGYQRIIETEILFAQISEYVEHLITCQNVGVFLFGGCGNFDSLCYSVVKKLKEKYSHIKAICVQAYYKPKGHKAIKNLQSIYDQVYYPELSNKPKHFAVLYRNKVLIDASDYCLFFVESGRSCAYQAFKYAKSKKKDITNFAIFI